MAGLAVEGMAGFAVEGIAGLAVEGIAGLAVEGIAGLAVEGWAGALITGCAGGTWSGLPCAPAEAANQADNIVSDIIFIFLPLILSFCQISQKEISLIIPKVRGSITPYKSPSVYGFTGALTFSENIVF